MRLHHLSITAFGPFAETVSVDFDDLSSAGLFLLSGATGAGKTSVLDAISFALYGDVPGDRSTAKRFRCDNAAPGIAPRVVLQATLGGRRFRITRSPAWTRPKKRGTGTTTEQAHVVIEEHLASGWTPLSNRLDETGQLVTSLVGMTMAQFCQVVMLPQGDFQAFLRASSEERHRLLQQLFNTQHFQDIEQWLREHARQLNRDVQAHQRTVARVVTRLLEASGLALPDDWPADDLAEVMDDGRLAAWAQQQHQVAEAAVTTARASEAEARSRATTATEAREQGQRLATLQQRAATARAQLADLAARAEEVEARRQRLARAHRAAPMAPLHRLAVHSTQQHERAAEEALSTWHLAIQSLRDAPAHEETCWDSEPTVEMVRKAAIGARRTAAVAAALLPKEPDLASLLEGMQAAAAAIAGLEERRASLVQEAERLPGRIAELASQLADAREQQQQARALAIRQADLEDRTAAASRLVGLRAELAAVEQERTAVIDTCHVLKEHWLGLREARIAGIAAELAHDLAVGADCPVCGSPEHPSKATPAPDAPSPQQEKRARRELDDAEAARTAVEDRVRELSVTISALDQQAGDAGQATLASELAETRTALAAAESAAARVPELEPALALATRTLEATASQVATTDAKIAAAAARLEADGAAAERLERELAEIRGEHPDLDTLIADQHRLAEACEKAVRHEELRVAARRAADDAARALAEWLDEHDFASVEQAVAGLLEEHGITRLARQVDAHDSALDRATSVLEDPEVADAEAVPAPDLPQLDRAAQDQAREAEAAATHLTVADRRSSRMGALVTELGAAVDAWRPVHSAHVVAAGLAGFVEGKSADNELRMRLSAFVLAWRLTQVVAAANERLLRMSDARYTLEHTGRRGARETRGGLSLLVRDEWSGDARDPATLSGGETFVVSLALALGLADVVTREAGGADLDTLFVDEGFGSLDSDTLDDVMDTLDSLRDGGRVVGVVSHVAEMRSRIPTQLRVTKDRSGSSVETVRTAG